MELKSQYDQELEKYPDIEYSEPEDIDLFEIHINELIDLRREGC